MPAPGDQHDAIVNPFDEARPRVSEFTAKEIATLQSRLEKQLGPEYLSARTGPSGQKVHYIAAEKCIELANQVFGFNGWSSSIQNVTVDFVDEHPQTFKISLGLSVIVRVTLRDGTFHEDIGYGHAENYKGKAVAFEKAKKEGTTDAMKRAMRSFGNVLGNCLYDKAYIQKVTKLKVGPTKFDEDGLHRHMDFIKKEKDLPVKSESSGASTSTADASARNVSEDFLGEFDEADFAVGEEGMFDDWTVLENSATPKPTMNPAPMQPPSRPLARSHSASNSARPGQTPNASNARLGPPPQVQQVQRPAQPMPNQQRPHNNNNSNNGQRPSNAQPPRPNMNANAGSVQPGPQTPMGGAPVAFFSARAVPKDGSENANGPTAIPQSIQLFNPKAESPSIRKTPGIDHTTSKPLARDGQHVAPAPVQPPAADDKPAVAGGAPTVPSAGPTAGRPETPGVHQQQNGMGRGNVLNPQFNQARRIGAPGGASSPLANRGQYKPPTMKRPAGDGGAATAVGGARPVLADVSNNAGGVAVAQGGGPGAPAGDAKRQKLS